MLVSCGPNLPAASALKNTETSGVMMLDTTALTIAVKAPPMTTATARSMTLPWAMNSLNPLNIGSPCGCVLRPQAEVADVAGAGVEPVDESDFDGAGSFLAAPAFPRESVR